MIAGRGEAEEKKGNELRKWAKWGENHTMIMYGEVKAREKRRSVGAGGWDQPPVVPSAALHRCASVFAFLLLRNPSFFVSFFLCFFVSLFFSSILSFFHSLWSRGSNLNQDSLAIWHLTLSPLNHYKALNMDLCRLIHQGKDARWDTNWIHFTLIANMFGSIKGN